MDAFSNSCNPSGNLLTTQDETWEPTPAKSADPAFFDEDPSDDEPADDWDYSDEETAEDASAEDASAEDASAEDASAPAPSCVPQDIASKPSKNRFEDWDAYGLPKTAPNTALKTAPNTAPNTAPADTPKPAPEPAPTQSASMRSGWEPTSRSEQKPTSNKHRQNQGPSSVKHEVLVTVGASWKTPNKKWITLFEPEDSLPESLWNAMSTASKEKFDDKGTIAGFFEVSEELRGKQVMATVEVTLSGNKKGTIFVKRFKDVKSDSAPQELPTAPRSKLPSSSPTESDSVDEHYVPAHVQNAIAAKKTNEHHKKKKAWKTEKTTAVKLEEVQKKQAQEPAPAPQPAAVSAPKAEKSSCDGVSWTFRDGCSRCEVIGTVLTDGPNPHVKCLTNGFLGSLSKQLVAHGLDKAQVNRTTKSIKKKHLGAPGLDHGFEKGTMVSCTVKINKKGVVTIIQMDRIQTADDGWQTA